jgi:hypothetical protein
MTEGQCHICQHPQRLAIEQKLAQGWTYRRVAAAFGGFSLMGLTRHRPHRPREALQPAPDGPVARPMWLGSQALCPRCHWPLTLDDAPVPCVTCGTWVQQPVRGRP